MRLKPLNSVRYYGMQGTAHAILLITLTLGSLLAVALSTRRTPSRPQAWIAVLLAGVGMAIPPACNHHRCWEGEPRMQWLILGPCLGIVLLFVGSTPWRRVVGALVFVGMVGLSCHFTHLVHESPWTGNPDYPRIWDMRLRWLNDAASTAAAESPNANADVTAGWLRDLPVWGDVQQTHGDEQPSRREVRRLWHTGLTGFYHRVFIPQDFWYPGGVFKEAFGKVELRDRSLK